MGYYTSFTITATKDKDGFEEITREENLKIARKLCQLSNWFEISDLDEESQFPLEDLIESDQHKWYDHFDEMKELSERFPNVYFKLHGFGENAMDVWKEYFYQGKGFHSAANFTYKLPKWLDDNEDEKPAKLEVCKYYERPTQVKYLDVDNGCDVDKCSYVGALAYRNELICGCCGGIASIEEIYKTAREMGIDEKQVIIPFNEWCDISEAIQGE